MEPSAVAPDLGASSLCEALALLAPKALVSIVGGGGKSALLFALARELPGRTILSTTTRIFAAQTARAEEWHCLGTRMCDEALRSDRDGVLVIGEVEGEKAKGVPIGAPAELLGTPGVDFVVVEADGSRMLPAKAPAPHEPVVPAETTLLIVVAGVDALNGSISKTCHRPERVASLLGVTPEDQLDPTGLAALLCHVDGGLKDAPTAARVALFLNKVESPGEWAAGRAFAERARLDPRVDRIVLGAVEPSEDGVAPPSAGGRTGFEVYLGRAAKVV